MSDVKSYVTRGAILVCDCGTHCRRVNLIADHGWGIDVAAIEDEEKKPHPFILSCDTIVGDEGMGATEQQNISWFGVCGAGVKGTDDVTLLPDKILKPNETKNEYGKKCKPVILSTWQNTKESIEVYSQTGAGYPITTDSYLVCKYGGYIKIMPDSNGNEYDGKMDRKGPSITSAQ